MLEAGFLDAGRSDSGASDGGPGDGSADAGIDPPCDAPENGWCVPLACYSDLPADRTFGASPPTCEALPAGEPRCCPANLRPPPETAASTLYLDRDGCAEVGSCGGYLADAFPRRRGLTLPSDPAAYPLKVVLPALAGPDPACASVCDSPLDETAAGFAITVPEGLIGFGTTRGLAISVPAPWFFVSGGCGEACPYPCVGGYQEFGVQSCYTLSFGDFGLSTADPGAPSVEALIDLVDAGDTPFHEYAPDGCCLFAMP